MENLKWEFEFLLMVVKNNARKNSYVQAKIENTHKNYKCMLLSDKFNQIIVFNWNHVEMRVLNLRIDFLKFIVDLITVDTVTRLSIPIRGRVKNHLKKARGEIWPTPREEESPQ